LTALRREAGQDEPKARAAAAQQRGSAEAPRARSRLGDRDSRLVAVHAASDFVAVEPAQQEAEHITTVATVLDDQNAPGLADGSGARGRASGTARALPV